MDKDLERLEREAVEREEREREEIRRKKKELSKKEEDTPVSSVIIPDTDDMDELAQAMDPVVFKALCEMAANPETPAAVRKSAIDSVLAYTRGKPMQEGKKERPEGIDDRTASDKIKEKILRMIPHDKLEELISEFDEEGSGEGEPAPDI